MIFLKVLSDRIFAEVGVRPVIQGKELVTNNLRFSTIILRPQETQKEDGTKKQTYSNCPFLGLRRAEKNV